MIRVDRCAGALLATLCLSLAACTGDEDTDAGLASPDATVSADATVPTDAAAASDAAATQDAGDQGDTGVFPDASEPDAAPMDAGEPEDVGFADSGVVMDAAAPDAAAPDAAPEDAGFADAGMVMDAGSADATVMDASPADAMAMDATPGDAAASDAGMAPDAGAAPMCNPGFGPNDACGGSPVGTWQYREACSNATPFAMNLQGCPNARVNNVVRTAGGTLTLDANGTFTRVLNTTVTGQLLLPSTCLPAGVICSSLGLFIPTVIPGASGSCTGVTTCDCQVSVAGAQQDTGAYVTSAGIITTGSGTDMRQYWYCADPSGAALEYRGLPTNVTDNDTTYLLTP